MNTHPSSSERGQVLVLIVLAVVALLGFTALAIDGSMLYSDRRWAQNGSDASSLAGGGAAGRSLGLVVLNNEWTTPDGNCLTGNASTAAQSAKFYARDYSTKNSFSITGVNSMADYDASQNVVTTVCGSETIPGINFQKHFMDVLVKITQDTRTTFAHFVFKGALQNTVDAITRIYPAQPFGFGNVIIALNPDDACNPVKNGAVFFGTPGVHLMGGGIYSNGCVVAKDPSINVIIDDGDVYYGSGLNIDEDAFTLLNGDFLPVDHALDLREFDVPFDCTGHMVDGDDLVDRTGLTGLYCVNGDLSVNSHGSNVYNIQGENVTFIMLGGKVTINGGASTSLMAPRMDYIGEALPGILFYLPTQFYGNFDGTGCGWPNQELKINGTSENVFRGTILAPCSDIQVEGTSDNVIFQSQIIGWNIGMGGTTGTSVSYQERDNGFNPASLDLYE